MRKSGHVYIIICSFSFAFLISLGCGYQAADHQQVFSSSFDTGALQLQKKLFPLYSILNGDKTLQRLIGSDTLFNRIAAKKRDNLAVALQDCLTVGCYQVPLLWSEDEIAAAGDELVMMYQAGAGFRRVIGALKKQNYFADTVYQADTILLRLAWESAVRTSNNILNVYVAGNNPLYAKIDAISFAEGDNAYTRTIHDFLVEQTKSSRTPLLLALPVALSIKALQLNNRNEAIRYDPLNSGLNALPEQAMKKIRWQDYNYSLILVPGRGPEQKGVALDSGGASRCQAAVDLYQRKLAPFIVVSGGHVHPSQTPYCEAVEMKNYLVSELGVPAAAVLIEPYARHTTTNLRNVSRMVYFFNIPDQKPILISTDAAQNAYINSGMAKTAMRDLGYLPYVQLKQLDASHSEFLPSTLCLQQNPFDPLDP